MMMKTMMKMNMKKMMKMMMNEEYEWIVGGEKEMLSPPFEVDH